LRTGCARSTSSNCTEVQSFFLSSFSYSCLSFLSFFPSMYWLSSLHGFLARLESTSGQVLRWKKFSQQSDRPVVVDFRSFLLFSCIKGLITVNSSCMNDRRRTIARVERLDPLRCFSVTVGTGVVDRPLVLNSKRRCGRRA
jgi:hypothetical protein